MKHFVTAMLAGVALSFSLATAADAKDKTIAVSWKTFQEERWKTDEAAIKAVVEAAGDKYISTDAQGSAQKQAADIEGLISQKVDVILGSRSTPTRSCPRSRRSPTPASRLSPMTCSSRIRTRCT